MTEIELDDFLSEPSAALTEMMGRLDGDIMILGVAGKMGITLARKAAKAIERAGVKKQVIGVARFSKASEQQKLDEWGIRTIRCDLMDPAEVATLPLAKNILFMAGRKFGTEGEEALTWAANVVIPANVVDRFRASSIVAFSTGCVYPLKRPEGAGCTEEVAPAPIGEYAQSCLGRERIFQYGALTHKTKVLIYRLNYAIDLRYGVLHDIARQIWNDEPVNNSVGFFNAIWQGDANDIALRCLEHCAAPAAVLNVTGMGKIAVAEVAEALGKVLGKPVRYRFDPKDAAASICYLGDATRMNDLFAPCATVTLPQMIQLQGDWIKNGGGSLGKPTHYEVNDGKF
ncbi:MAG: NAD(P)-dependent oxidoreductase [Kiritimatiellaeota bacterium]|nr:NAD(P)-dependent oxidoreductase [Kiritimatiellota bacterium]